MSESISEATERAGRASLAALSFGKAISETWANGFKEGFTQGALWERSIVGGRPVEPKPLTPPPRFRKGDPVKIAQPASGYHDCVGKVEDYLDGKYKIRFNHNNVLVIFVDSELTPPLIERPPVMSSVVDTPYTVKCEGKIVARLATNHNALRFARDLIDDAERDGMSIGAVEVIYTGD